MIYYTADMHFGYEPILGTTQRPFHCIPEMDETLIDRWNRKVTEEDTVYIVGDLCGHGEPLPLSYLDRLKGHKHLIRGNHDTCLPDQEKLFEYLETITDFTEIDDEMDGRAQHILLCHYPFIYFQRGYMIHGHIHNLRGDTYYILKNMPHVLNCGVDVNHYEPVTLKELIANNQAFYADEKLAMDPALRQKKSGKSCGGWRPDFRPLPVRPEREMPHED